jgi:hypothetical protein
LQLEREDSVAAGNERRQYGRIDLDPPLSGRIDDVAVRVIEVSVSGVLVEHDTRIMPAPSRRIRFDWDIHTLQFTCVVARSTLFKLAKNPGESSVYRSGIKLLQATGDSEQVLRDLIAQKIIRALEQQKANARGLPPVGNYTYQVGKGDRFRRCELTAGNWRRMETGDRSQPLNGFTVSAEVDVFHVDLLCKTWENTTEEGRRLTRMLAELSISKEEGTPVRKYVP